MEKEFVPYAESLELKQLGFNEPCILLYRGLDMQPVCQMDYEFKTEKNSDYNDETNYWLTVPTYSQAFRWFRKKYKLWGNIGMQASDYYTLMVYETLPDCCWILYNNKGYETDEEAELACLRKLIDLVKQKP